MNGLRRELFWQLTAGLSVVLWALGAGAATPVSFIRDVAPVFVKQCQGCHGAEKQKGKYRLDSFERLMKAGESKDAPVVAGKPGASAIYRLITAKDEDDRMPQKADPLPAAQVTLLRQWIEEGANFDGADAAAPLVSMVKEEEHAAPPEVYRQPVAVTALAFSPDGKQLAVSGYHEVTLWDPADGKLVGRIQKLAERTTGLSYSPDGKWLAIAGGTPGTLGEVRLCDAASPDAAGTVLERIGDVMLAVRFSPDGTRLAAGGADNAIRIYNVKSGKRELLIEQHADWVTDLAFSPDGLQLASASRDKSARIFDAKTGAMHAAFLLHEEPVFGVAWDAAGKNVFSAGRDRKVRVWNVSDAKPVGDITGFPAEPFHIEASADGMLFCSCADGVVRQYSQEKRELVRAYPKAPEWVYSVAVDAKNRRLAAGCYNGEVRVWNTDDGKAVSAFVAAPGYVGKATPPTSP
jgi:mono/diheme cytochrome c family protein